jgi:uncharacterized Ntn-hydrolase superfamily protein
VTFSIVARCPETGAFGIGAATGMPGVGKLLTHARAGIGAVATQGLLNPYLGLDGLAHLHGRTAPDALEAALAGDPDRDARQLALVDAAGRTAVWTGADCIEWAGDRFGEGYVIQGNLLAGPAVLERCEAAFLAARGLPFPERLLLALEAGEDSGGDRRGTESATIYVVEREEYPLWDIRVDSHERPLAELRRLHAVFARDLVPHIRAMPTRDRREPSADRGWAA